MRGVVFTGDRNLEIRDFPDPIPGPRDVILEIKASGMCGSDLHRYRAPFNPGDTSSGFKLADEPMIAGHEPCGVVAELGSAVSGQEAKIGAATAMKSGTTIVLFLCKIASARAVNGIG